MAFGTWRLWGCQPHTPAAFTLRKCFWYPFSLGAKTTQGPWWGRKKKKKKKSSDTTDVLKFFFDEKRKISFFSLIAKVLFVNVVPCREISHPRTVHEHLMYCLWHLNIAINTVWLLCLANLVWTGECSWTIWHIQGLFFNWHPSLCIYNQHRFYFTYFKVLQLVLFGLQTSSYVTH
jgi:hypothetical protein